MKSLSALFSLRLRARLMLFTLTAAFCSIGIVAAMMLWNARENADAAARADILSALDLRKGRLESYLADVSGDLAYLAANPATAEGLTALTFNFGRTNPDTLQRAYITENPHAVGEKHKLTRAELGGEQAAGYHGLHARVHKGLRTFLEERGYYDIFLISTEGDIVYSVFKELDYATNLRSGAYANSGLADVWRAASGAGSGSISFTDFAPYAPSYGAPAAFVAVPVMGVEGTPQAGRVQGVLAAQIPIDRLTHALHAGGVDAAQDVFILGPDDLLRTPSTLTDGDDVLQTQFAAAPKPGAVSIEAQDTIGRAAYAGFVEVDAFGTPWRIVQTNTEANVFAGFQDQLTSGIISVLPVMLLALGTSWFIAQSLARPVNALKEATGQLAEGKRVDIPTRNRHDEFGELSRSMLALNDNAIQASRSAAALSVSSVATAICDKDFNIVFANEALYQTVRQSEDHWRKKVPGFSVDGLVGTNIDIFHLKPGHQRAVMQGLHGPHDAEIAFDRYIAGLKVFPIDDDLGRIGYLLQWEDLTAQRTAEAAIEGAIAAASGGDFSERVHLNSDDPFFNKLEEGLNLFFEEVETFLADLDRTLEDFAGGNLQAKLQGTYSGQLGSISDRVTETASELEIVIGKVKDVGDAIRASSHEIADDANNLAQRTESQGASIEETAASMEEISSTVKENAENSSIADARAAEATKLAEEGRGVVARTVAAMAAIRESAGQISEVTSIIESLAFETHLLSLNASVEAARAGEAGKGFGVVAAEVGSLARRSTDEAKAIKKLIMTSEAQVAEGDRLVGETDVALSDIIGSVRTAAEMIAQIADASSSQSRAIDEIAIAVAEMDNVTQQNSQLAEKSSVSASVLTEQAEEMMEAVALFTAATDPRQAEARQDAVWSSLRGDDGVVRRA